MTRLFYMIAAVGLMPTAAFAQSEITKKDTINEVVVTGTNQTMPSRLLPYTVSTVSQRQIEATGCTQLLSALNGRIPSLFVTERNIFGFGVSTGGSGSIKIRGVGGSPTNQVLMMVDGKPQFAGVFSHPIADNYESEYVDHIEIVRGPTSVLYGSNAMGGAINVITRRVHEEGVRTTFRSQYGSYNTSQSAITNTVRKGNFSSLVSLGYDRTDGTEKDFDFWQASGYAKVGYDFNDYWNAYADYSLMKFVGNDPIYAPTYKNADDIYHQDVVRGEASIVVSNSYEKSNGAVRLYYGHGDNKICDPKDFEMMDDRIGILAYQNFQPWREGNLTLGFDFDRYTGEVPLSGGIKRSDKVTPATMGYHGINEYSPYITASQGLCDNLLVFNAGTRMANSNVFGTQWVPQVGLSLNPGQDWNLKANMSKGYRNPSFKELFLYKMANPDLKPEEMTNYEASIGKSFSHLLSFEVTGYIAKGSNLIYQSGATGLNENSGKFCNKGFEFSAQSHPHNNLSLRATYSYMYTNLEKLTGAPKHQYSMAADWVIMPQLTLYADFTGVSRLYVADDVDMQNYLHLNMKVSYRVIDNLDLFVQGNNLSNTEYCINKGYTMPGITVNGGFKFRF